MLQQESLSYNPAATIPKAQETCLRSVGTRFDVMISYGPANIFKSVFGALTISKLEDVRDLIRTRPIGFVMQPDPRNPCLGLVSPPTDESLPTFFHPLAAGGDAETVQLLSSELCKSCLANLRSAIKI